MKILVTGSTGLVGTQITHDLTEQNHDVYSCYNFSKPKHGNPVHLDLLNEEEILDVINTNKPEVIIHLAAMTGVDQCEEQPEIAMKVNSKSTGILARQAAKQNAFFLYISTDYVFDGNKGMKKESDVTNPLSYYGKSKLAGEHTLNNLASPYAIARTSTPFGLHDTKKSFPIWVKDNLESKKEIPVLVDQITSPTYVPNLSKMLIEIATRQLVGVFHTVGATKISRYNFAEMIAEKLNLEKRFLRPVSMYEMNWKAQRPKDSSLDVSFVTEILNEKPQPVQQNLDLLFPS